MHFNGLISNLLSELAFRQRDIIENRFGLNGKKKTLAAIGKKYSLTRERVRQIESASLKVIAKEIKENRQMNEVLEVAINHLKKVGGVIKESDFLNGLKWLFKDNLLTNEQIRFIFEAAGVPYYQLENNNFYAFWYLNNETRDNAVDFVKKLEKFIFDKKEDIITRKKFDEIFSQIAKSHNVKDFIALNFVAIYKKFGVNQFGDFGLSKWEEITPKTARAKAYLILKKHNAPLHFKEIAKRINDFKLNKKKIIHQTIHNELIKDPRFVLVGRGMYGLSEFGLKPGVAKDVIARILKIKGPLQKEEVIDLVKQERFLKDNTILLNLQNKKHFKKTADGRYYVN